MSEDLVTTAHLDYLQRVGIVPSLVHMNARTPLTSCLPEGVSLARVVEIGRREKLAVPPAAKKRETSAAAGFPSPSEPGERIASEDVLIGLYRKMFPLAFFLRGDEHGIALYLGNWSPKEREQAAGPAIVRERQQILNTTLQSLYPSLTLAPVELAQQTTFLHWEGVTPSEIHAGFVLGVPTIKPVDPTDGSLPLDRMIRALSGSRWAVLVLADPVSEEVPSYLRNQVIDESRKIQSYESSSTGSPGPLAQYYLEMLQRMLLTFTNGLGEGMWRTGVYLLGDREGYHRLESLWRSIFSGNQSFPEPIRVWQRPEVVELASRWALLDEPERPGPGQFRHVFQYQTLLTSSQLSAYIHLPNLETSGLPVRIVPDFDVVPPPVQDPAAFSLGTILHHTRVTRIPYRVSTQSLTRHVFVSGMTGAGKTNTIFHLLKQSRVPFLLLEPAKTEYRALLYDQRLTGTLQIFTPGDEMTSPFRFNPFEVPPGTSVNTHLDLLRSVFVASFGLWSPLPLLLEQCLHRIYADRGWDPLTNTNQRLANASSASFPEVFPTLSDLVAAVADVLNTLDYDKEVKGNMRTALLVRLQALCIGGKGAMLNVQNSIPIEMLLEQSTILELEGMGDDDDRALMMGLILIRLYEYRRAQGQIKQLQHLLIIEEAHRLLTNVGEKKREEEANPRGKAVETFTNLLSEIRAYGQGIIIADQVPVKLAPDVIKNTGLKIVHQIVALDDRSVLAGAMAMNEHQAIALATLPVGHAVVFSEGDDVPLLVRVPLTKGDAKQAPPASRQIATYMGTMQKRLPHLFLPFPECQGGCSSARGTCQTAQQLVASVAFQRAFTRVVLSMLEDGDALDRMWDDILLVMRAHRPIRSDEQELMHCLLTRAAHWFAERCGSQAHWSYAQTREMAKALRQVLLDKYRQTDPQPARAAFQQSVRKLHMRHYDPYPFCHRICQQQPPMCFYRSAVADLVASGRMKAAWDAAYNQDIQPENKHKQRLWIASQDAIYELMEFPEDASIGEAQRRAGLCFAQQMLITDENKVLPTVRAVLQQLLKEAQ